MPAPAELTGAQRAAAFLLSLDREAAAEVLRHLPDEVVSEVAEAMTALPSGGASPEDLDALYVELSQQAGAGQRVMPADRGTLSELLSRSKGEERGEAILGRIDERARMERPFAAVEAFAPPAIAGVLRGESPAVSALVLAHLEPATAAAVLTSFEQEAALDIVRRMTSLQPPGFSTLESIARDVTAALEREGDGGGGGNAADAGRRLQTIAEMLAFSGEDMEKNVLAGLEQDMAEVAQEIRENMFTWEDLAGVDKRAMQKILGSVNTKTLSIALKGCSDAVEANVLNNLSSRVRDMVAEERELAGAMPMSEVQANREEILTAVRALMDSGEFRPTRAGEDLVS